MNLAAIRDFNENDPPTGLGPKVERPAPEPAQPAEVRPGIVVGPDGKMSTNIPPPAPPESPADVIARRILDALPEPAPVDDAACAREPLKVGDWVRFVDDYVVDELRGAVVQVVRFDYSDGRTAEGWWVGPEDEGTSWTRCAPPDRQAATG